MESEYEIDTREVLACDESFFTALLGPDHDLLGTILADDVYTCDDGRWHLMSAQGTPTRAPGVSAGRAPLFCDAALAGRIERVESQLIAQATRPPAAGRARRVL